LPDPEPSGSLLPRSRRRRGLPARPAPWRALKRRPAGHIVRAMDLPRPRYIVQPDPHDPRLTERVTGVDQTGAPVETAVTVERGLTIFLNSQEIVTAMTINDYPEYLALGYLLNQNMLQPDDV